MRADRCTDVRMGMCVGTGVMKAVASMPMLREQFGNFVASSFVSVHDGRATEGS